MDVLKKTYRQFLDLYKSMSASQRMTLIVVPLMVLAAFAFLLFSEGASSYVALSWGKVYTTEELMRAEQTLIDAGLTEFRREGQRLMVPAGDVDRYNAALVDGGGLPPHWAEELEKSLKDGGLFQSKAQLQAKMDIVLGKELRRVLRALPDIEDASVKWARSNPRRWPHTETKVTALVSVRPRGGRELSMQRIESLRYAAASMVPDLDAKQVTVLNQLTGDAYRADADDNPFDSRFLQKVRDYTRDYENRIAGALSYIPGVLVTVNVDLENLRSSTERKRTVDTKTVTIQQSEGTRTSTSNDRTAAAEPGAQANTPNQLQAQAAATRSEQTTETNSASTNLPTVTVSDKEFVPAMLESVQVAVSIPRAYTRTVALETKQSTASPNDPNSSDAGNITLTAAEIAQAEADIKTRVQPQVMKLIPRTSAADAVDISFHVPGEPEVDVVHEGVLETVGRYAGRWGGALGMALFALWALWMLNKSMSRLPSSSEETDEPEFSLAIPQTPDDDDEQQEPSVPEPTKRDELQAVIHDDPEMAAAVLSKWLQAVK